MSQPNRTKVPIGLWLKRADQAITRATDQALGTWRVTRFHWQVLHTVHEAGVVSRGQVYQAVRNFVDAAGFEAILNELEQRDWLASPDDPALLELSAEGQHAHADLIQLQSEVRQRTVQGVSEQDYETTLRVLQRIVANLE